MRPGRKSKPTELKRRAGNPGHRPLPEPLSIVPMLATSPTPPERLGSVGSDLWALVWRDGQEWLAPSDAPLVGLLCSAADEREAWLEVVTREGPTFTTERGYSGIHPLISQVRAIGRDMVSMLSLLGFTPSDRARLGLAEVRRMTHLSELMQRRKADLGR